MKIAFLCIVIISLTYQVFGNPIKGYDSYNSGKYYGNTCGEVKMEIFEKSIS